MTCKMFERCGAGAVIALAATASATTSAVHAGTTSVATFDTGRFVAETGEVHAGLFGATVAVDALTVGEATFRSRLDELIDVASVRVYVAPALDADGPFQLLTDEQVASGEFGVAFGLGREIDQSRYSTTLDVMQGLDLSRMLYADGTKRVRVDVILAAALRDSMPGQFDLHPEVLLLGSFGEQHVRIGAIVGGNVDRPILAGDPVQIDQAGFYEGQTGISILLDRDPQPHPVSIVGLDLYGLGVRDESPALGYRLEIEPGEPVMFNLVGVGRDWQRVLSTPIALLEETEGEFDFASSDDDDWFFLGAIGDVGIAMSQPLVRRGVGGAGGTRGGGGGGGGSGPGLLAGGNGPGNGNGNGSDDSNGNGDGPGNGNNDPVIPAPGTLLIVLASALSCKRRRRRA